MFWYGKAADQGDTDAMYNMVSILMWEDESGHIDYQTGFKLLHKAYELGADWAAEELGFAYNGCPNEQYRDVIKALKYNKEAAIKGSGVAAYYVGRAYISGKGVPADMSEAIVWMKFAADHGDEGALKNLAVYYSVIRQPSNVLDIITLSKQTKKHVVNLSLIEIEQMK